MIRSKKYILHPAYCLRNDERRVVLTSFDERVLPEDIKRIPYNQGDMFIIHPLNAQMLSFFDGNHTLGECMEQIADYFELDETTVTGIIEHYIENKKPLCIVYNGYQIHYPINILIPKGNFTRSEYYRPENFIITEELDLSFHRFYRPLRIAIELTMQCYTDCIYCYADRSHRANENLLSVERMKEIIRECKSLGIVDLSINGGEVLMHPHYKEIFTELAANSFYPLISTKKPLDEETLVFLKSIGMNTIQISLDSVNSQTLSKTVHGGEGYLEKMRHTMQLLDNMQFNWSVHTILTKYNSDVEREIKPLIKEMNSYPHLRSFRIDPVGYSMYKSPKNFNSLKPTLTEVQRVHDYISSISRQIPSYKITMGEGEVGENCESGLKKIHFKKRALCSGNQSAFVILPDGSATICEELYWHPNFIIGDLKTQSVLDVWKSEKAKALYHLGQQAIHMDSPCHRCKTFIDCREGAGVCWKVILYAYGSQNWDFPDPRCPFAPEPMNEYYLK